MIKITNIIITEIIKLYVHNIKYNTYLFESNYLAVSECNSYFSLNLYIQSKIITNRL